ncbi:MAG: 30S ribosomal protein S3 [Armatimonadota bacterium]|nr:30S ribosomal protein S3 [Armatimonadota bacterium]
MGQKVNPIGLRVGIIREPDSKWFATDREFPALVLEDYKIRKFLKNALYAAGVSKIEIERAANRVKVTIWAAKPGIIIGRGGRGIDDIRADLEKLTGGKTVIVNVQEIRTPELDAQLVAESIAQQIEKRISYKRACKQAVLRTMRAGAKGIKVRVAGRLAGAEMARVDGEKAGKIPLHTLRADIDYGFTEAKTTYGNIGVKVWIYKGDVLPGAQREESIEEQIARRPRRTRAANRESTARRPETGETASGAAGEGE